VIPEWHVWVNECAVVRKKVDAEELEAIEKETRIFEARRYLKRIRVIGTWSRVGSLCLTFSQVVVGGVMASSFVQQSLSKEMIGGLGVLVLISSLIHKWLCPDLQYRRARQKSFHLTWLLREAEDKVYFILLNESQNKEKSILEIRQSITKELHRIEEKELDDYDAEKEYPDLHLTR